MYETAETSTNYLHLPFFLFQSFDTFLDKILNKKWNGKTWTSTEVKHKWITKHGKCKLIGFLWNKWFQSNIVAHCTVSLFLFFFKQTDSRIQHLRLVRIKFGKLKSEFKTKWSIKWNWTEKILKWTWKLFKIRTQTSNWIFHCPNLLGAFLARSDLLTGSWNVTFPFFDPSGLPLGRFDDGDIGSVVDPGVISIVGAGVDHWRAAGCWSFKKRRFLLQSSPRSVLTQNYCSFWPFFLMAPWCVHRLVAGSWM